MKEIYQIYIDYHERKIGINEFKQKLKNISKKIECEKNYNLDFYIYDDIYINYDDKEKLNDINLCLYKSTSYL